MQLSEVTRRHLPLLHEHLARVGFPFEVLAAQWLLTLLTTALPPASLRRIWDAMLESASWKAPMRAIVALLGRVERRVLGCDIGDIARMFRLWKDAVSADADPRCADALRAEWPELGLIFEPAALVLAARAVKVTRSMLDAAEEAHALRVIEQKTSAGLGASPLPPRVLFPAPRSTATVDAGRSGHAVTNRVSAALAAMAAAGVPDAAAWADWETALTSDASDGAVAGQALILPLVLSPDASPESLRLAFDAALLAPLSSTTPQPSLRVLQPSQDAYRLHRKWTRERESGGHGILGATGAATAAATQAVQPGSHRVPLAYPATAEVSAARVVPVRPGGALRGSNTLTATRTISSPQVVSVLRPSSLLSPTRLLSPLHDAPASGLHATGATHSRSFAGTAARGQIGVTPVKGSGPSSDALATPSTATSPRVSAAAVPAQEDITVASNSALDAAIASLPLFLAQTLGRPPQASLHATHSFVISEPPHVSRLTPERISTKVTAGRRRPSVTVAYGTPGGGGRRDSAAPADSLLASPVPNIPPPTRRINPYAVGVIINSPHAVTGAPLGSPAYMPSVHADAAAAVTASPEAELELAVAGPGNRFRRDSLPLFIDAPGHVAALTRQLSGLLDGPGDSLRISPGTMRRRLEFDVEESAAAAAAAAVGCAGEGHGATSPASSPLQAHSGAFYPTPAVRPTGAPANAAAPAAQPPPVPLAMAPGAVNRRHHADDGLQQVQPGESDVGPSAQPPLVFASAAVCAAVRALPVASHGCLSAGAGGGPLSTECQPPALDTRLDDGPAFYFVLHALAEDVSRIDATVRSDVGVLTRKVGAVRAAEKAAADEAAILAARLADADARTSAMLDQKRAAAHRLHALMIGQPLKQLQDPQLPVDAALQSVAAEMHAAPGPESIASKATFPASNRAALARFSALLSTLDARVREASGAWKEALWAHTLADTRLHELSGARQALMDQLVAVVLHAEEEKHALRLRTWRALVQLWLHRGQQAE